MQKMLVRVLATIGVLVVSTSAFLFPTAGRGGDCGCGCAAPTTPPPPAPCAAVAAPARARNDKTVTPGAQDELELPVETVDRRLPHAQLVALEQFVDHSTGERVKRDTATSGEANGPKSASTPEPAPESDDDVKCNSQVLKKLMVEQMTENSSISKRRINKEAEKKFGGNIDVICSRGHFSYVYSSSLFCEATKGEVTCLAFRQSH